MGRYLHLGKALAQPELFEQLKKRFPIVARVLDHAE